MILFTVLAGPGALQGQQADLEDPQIAQEVDLASRVEGPPPPAPPEVISRDDQGNATIRAIRIEDRIELDGRLDEAHYDTIPGITGFIQSVPDEGAAPTERTEAWIFFDDDNIYVSARAHDSAPESEWVANEMRRDTDQLRQNDTFGVMFDTYYDRRNGVMFYTNPLGALAEFQITNEGNPNSDWNPVWDVRTGRFDGGWTVEMEIPFQSLRYRPGTEQIWGVQLRRAVRRKNEWNYLTFLPLAVSGTGAMGSFRVSRAGTLVGLEAPPTGRNIEVKPYAIAGLQTDRVASPEISNDPSADAGLDVKYGVTENLTLDLTYNTDFAQVEVDQQQVNLTRFSLFFPEKREFFLEGRGIFNFGQGGIGAGGGPGGGGGAAPTLFYSRRIGLEGGEPVDILGGGRITGKLGDFDVGAVNIQTRQAGQTRDDQSIDLPSTNFTVLRLRRDILERSSVGVLFENRSHSTLTGGSNQAYGADAAFSFLDDWNFVTYWAGTRTDELADRLTGSNKSYRGQFNYAGDLWGLGLDHLFVGGAFNPEIGFVRRRGFRQSAVSGRFSPRPASIEWIRQLTFEGSVDYFENEPGSLDRLELETPPGGFVETREIQGRVQVELENSDNLSISLTDRFEHLIRSERISGATIPAGRYSFPEFQISYNLGLQRRVSGNFSFLRGDYYGGSRTSIGFGRGRIEVLPQLSIEPSLSFNWIELGGENFDQHVAVTRVNYSFNPRMFLSGLVQYNSGSDTFSTNLRLRWEYAPGSEIFVVYTEDRDTDPIFEPDRSGDPWSELANRALVIKVTRLFRF